MPGSLICSASSRFSPLFLPRFCRISSVGCAGPGCRSRSPETTSRRGKISRTRTLASTRFPRPLFCAIPAARQRRTSARSRRISTNFCPARRTRASMFALRRMRSKDRRSICRQAPPRRFCFAASPGPVGSRADSSSAVRSNVRSPFPIKLGRERPPVG